MSWLLVLLLVLTLFNFIYVVLLSTRPLELLDSNGNTDYARIFWVSLCVLIGIVLVYGLVRLFMPRAV